MTKTIGNAMFNSKNNTLTIGERVFKYNDYFVRENLYKHGINLRDIKSTKKEFSEFPISALFPIAKLKEVFEFIENNNPEFLI